MTTPSEPTPAPAASIEERADLAYWFPKLVESGARVPRTFVVETDVDLWHLLDGDVPDGFAGFEQRLKAAAKEVGYPCFLRTGHYSGKHYWRETCYVPSEDVLGKHVVTLVNESAVVDMWGLPVQTWAVRELLPLAARFTAFHGLPINKERRYFIRDGVVVCHHPYWPPDSILDANGDNWEAKLEELNYESPHEVTFLTSQSEIVSRHFDGCWSLDWAMTDDGLWYAIDMAPGERSFHWPDCPAHNRETPPVPAPGGES